MITGASGPAGGGLGRERRGREEQSSRSFLAEWYRPAVTGAVLDDVVAELERGAAELRGEGTPVELVMTLSVPTDEVVYCLYTASSAVDVTAACARAGFPAERISPDVDVRS